MPTIDASKLPPVLSSPPKLLPLIKHKNETVGGHTAFTTVRGNPNQHREKGIGKTTTSHNGYEIRRDRARRSQVTHQSLPEFLSLVHGLGMPRDQVENLLSAAFVPFPRQALFHSLCRAADRDDTPDWIGFGGARGPGKSTAAFAQVALDDCQRRDDLKVLFLRRVKKAAKESIEDLRAKILKRMPHKYNRQEGLITFRNGSRILIGHFTDERDLDAYLGLEYDIIVLEEATTLPWPHVEKLLGSLRTSRTDWRPRWITTTNPGGIGHQWFKRLFVDRKAPQSKRTIFIPATVDDNPMIDRSYRDYLDGLTGWLHKAWRKGDWNILAGQFYTNWSEAHHVIPVFQAPIDWDFWFSMDYGTVHPQVVYLLTMDGDGNIYVLDEHYQSGWLVDQHVEAMDNLLARNGLDRSHLSVTVAGSDVFARRGYSNTLAEEYAEKGYTLSPAKTDRINGAARLRRLLGDPTQGRPNTLFITEACPHLIEQIPTLQHDPSRPEDILKTNADEDGFGGDDCYDSLRYGIMEKTENSPQAVSAERLRNYRG